MTLAFARAYGGGSTLVYTGTSLIAPSASSAAGACPASRTTTSRAARAKFIAQNNVHLLEPRSSNDNNRLFVAGCTKAGFHAEQFPLNVRGCKGSSLCNLGCPNGAKQGTHASSSRRPSATACEVVTRAEALRVEERARRPCACAAPAPGEKGGPSRVGARRLPREREDRSSRPAARSGRRRSSCARASGRRSPASAPASPATRRTSSSPSTTARSRTTSGTRRASTSTAPSRRASSSRRACTSRSSPRRTSPASARRTARSCAPSRGCR